mmetsp:Transcript_5772/g.12553  ORF Transcript_5772/g.12553 Transcript_5772/m.12553 type:complete len:183 (-) Transcript_5772:1257-1805(-)
MSVRFSVCPKTSKTAKAMPSCVTGTVCGIIAIEIGMIIPWAIEIPTIGVKGPPGRYCMTVTAGRKAKEPMLTVPRKAPPSAKATIPPGDRYARYPTNGENNAKNSFTLDILPALTASTPYSSIKKEFEYRLKTLNVTRNMARPIATIQKVMGKFTKTAMLENLDLGPQSTFGFEVCARVETL